MKFEDYISIDPDTFNRMERAIAHPGKERFFVHDGRNPKKNQVYGELITFSEDNGLNTDDMWKFFVHFKYHWIGTDHFRDLSKYQGNKQKDLNRIKGLIYELNAGKKIGNKYHDTMLDSISFSTNIFDTVKITDEDVLSRIFRAIRQEFAEDGIRVEKSKRKDSFTKNFITGLKPFFSYLLETKADKNECYRIILQFLELIDPEIFKNYSADWIRKNLTF